MAVTFDAIATADAPFNTKSSPADCTTLTIGSGSNRALVAIIAASNRALTGVTCVWDPTGTNQAMTSLKTDITSTSSGAVYLFGLVAPTSGNKTIRFAWTGGGATDLTVDGVAWTGVDQTGSTTSFPNATSAKAASSSNSVVTVTSATGDAVVGVSANDTAVYGTHSQTLIFEQDTLGLIGACASRAAGAATITFTDVMTSPGGWVAAGTSIKAGGAVVADLSALIGEPITGSSSI